MQDQLTKLDALLSLVDTKSTMEDFVSSFEVVVKYVEQMKVNNEQERAGIKDLVYSYLEKCKKDLAGLHSKEALAMQAQFRDFATTIRDGKDGKDGLQGPQGPQGATVVGPKGDMGPAGKDGSPDTPDEVVAKVNEAKPLIKKERIEGLADIERIAKANAFDPAMGPSFADLKKLQDQITAAGVNNSGSKFSINYIIDGGGSAITTGLKGYVELPYDITITGWQIFADQVGSIVVDIWKDTYANFPPVVGDSITGSEKPTLSSAQSNQDPSLSTWTTIGSTGDILAFNVDSVSTVTRVTVTITGIKR